MLTCNIRRFFFISLLILHTPIAKTALFDYNVVMEHLDLVPKVVLPLLFTSTSYAKLCPVAATFCSCLKMKHTLVVPIINKAFHYLLVTPFLSYEKLPERAQKYFDTNFNTNLDECDGIADDPLRKNIQLYQYSYTNTFIRTGGQLFSELFFAYALGTLTPITGPIIAGTGILQLYAMHYKWFPGTN